MFAVLLQVVGVPAARLVGFPGSGDEDALVADSLGLGVLGAVTDGRSHHVAAEAVAAVRVQRHRLAARCCCHHQGGKRGQEHDDRQRHDVVTGDDPGRRDAVCKTVHDERAETYTR